MFSFECFLLASLDIAPFRGFFLQKKSRRFGRFHRAAKAWEDYVSPLVLRVATQAQTSYTCHVAKSTYCLKTWDKDSPIHYLKTNKTIINRKATTFRIKSTFGGLRSLRGARRAVPPDAFGGVTGVAWQSGAKARVKRSKGCLLVVLICWIYMSL